MDPVTLWECVRCHLVWVADTELIPNHCPACKIRAKIETPIIIAGRDVTVQEMREYGRRSCITNVRTRTSMKALQLACQCPHGCLHWSVCPDCKKVKQIP